MITLDPTSWEYAAKMKNFSGWVRKKLAEEFLDHANDALAVLEYWSYCKKCDLSATNSNKWIIEHKYCPKCHEPMEYKGLVE